jgi:hypothetical protein
MNNLVPKFADLSPLYQGNWVKRLGGSTGAYVFKTTDETKWIVKLGGKIRLKKNNGWTTNNWSAGAGEGQIAAEAAASDIYQITQTPVPLHRIDTFEALGKTQKALINQFIDGPLLKDVKATNKLLFNKSKSELSKDYAVDVLLANWDVLGALKGYDNIIVPSDGSPAVRIDNGSSFTFSGTGRAKIFDSEVDVESLKHGNPEIYGELSNDEIALQIREKILANRTMILEKTPDEFKDVMGSRIDTMGIWATKQQNRNLSKSKKNQAAGKRRKTRKAIKAIKAIKRSIY